MPTVKIPKKVNRHVLKAIDFLQTSKTDFVPIEAIQDQVRRSLRYTKPVWNLDVAIQDSLRKQTELGFVKRSGSSRYAITLAFSGLRSDRNGQQIGKKETNKTDSLTVDEIASVRKMLRGVKKPLVNKKTSMMSVRGKPRQYLRSTKPFGNTTPIICDKSAKSIDNFNVPKKVNRHVFKAVRNLSLGENNKFVPLDKIKMEARWSMKNLKPVKDIETVIERSLTNLSINGVLSEHLGSFRLNGVQSLNADSSFEIFGKVSETFFDGTPIDTYVGGQFSTQNNLVDLNVRAVDGAFQTEPNVGNASSIEDPFRPSLMVAESVSHEKHMLEEASSVVPIVIDLTVTEEIFGVEPPVENASSMEYSGPLMTDESPNISHMKAIEPLQQPMSEQTSSLVPITIDFRVTQGIYGGEPIDARVTFSHEMPNANNECEIPSSQDSHVSFEGAAQIFHDSLLQHISNQRPPLIFREDNLPTFTGGQFSPMTSDIDLNISPVEGIFGMASSVGNDSLMELDGSNFHVPLSQEIQNPEESLNISYIKGSEMPLDEPISDDLKVSVCQGTRSGSYLEGGEMAFTDSVTEGNQNVQWSTYIQASSLVPLSLDFRASEGVFGGEPDVQNASTGGVTFSQEQHNANSEWEMGLRASTQDDNLSFALAAQRFNESWLQSNEPPTLFLQEANSEAEEAADK